MNQKYILFLLLGIDACVLFLKIPDLSISYHEASLLYGDFSFLQLIIKTSLQIFGQNDFALRVPMIALHIGSAFLLYLISKNYVKEDKNRLWLVFVFVLLPGVISASILVNNAGLVIFGLFLFIYITQTTTTQNQMQPTKSMYILLVLFSLIDGGFNFLFLALILYSYYKKYNNFLIFNLILFGISIYLYGLDVYGLPQGHFLDAIGVYAAIFTPIVFIYIVYVLYRRYFTKDIDMVWFIASVAFVLSLILSFRQRIAVEQFAPYLIIALPLAAQTFYSSYRVRLKIFRAKYRLIFTLAIIFLILNSFLVFFNKTLYLVLENPKKHFAYKMHIAKELAQKLKNNGIYCVKSKEKMSQRLKFYNIQECENNLLTEYKNNENKTYDVTISYKNRPIYFADVTIVNNK